MANEMETFAARLATFDLVLHPDRRSSSSKSAEPVSWPHNSPSPAELAHAGFFYNPYETNPDNTTCFMCRRALDGWEAEDNPITEHLKHAPDCGWAVMMNIYQRSSNPAEIEDPTSETITQARMATFGESWPHDGKKGWLCQSEKMVEGGWFFCPNEESADLASCAYCKLSLDGWEPKDNPFDEHYRRSSDCSFFVFAKPSKGKGSRSKKGRTSKAARQSTQSTASEMVASDVEDMDQSVMSQPTKTKSTKKSSKSKSKTSKSTKEEPQPEDTASQMDVDEIEEAQPETSKPKRSTRGRKRSSADVHNETTNIANEEILDELEPERPAKKRATKRSTSRARSQSIMSTDADALEYESEVNEDENRGRSRGASKKKTTRGRNTSRASSTARTAPKSRMPRNSELDAAIEAGLEGDGPENMQTEEVAVEKPAPKKSKSKSKKKDKKTQETSEEAIDHSADAEVDMIPQLEIDQDVVGEVEQPEPEPEPARPQSKRRSSKKTAEEPAVKETAAARKKSASHERDEEERQHESFVSVEIVSKPPADYTEPETNDKDSKKSKKKKTEKTKKSKKDKASKTDKSDKTESEELQKPDEPENRHSETQELPQREASPPARQSLTPEPSKQEHKRDSSRRRSSMVPPKTTERYSDIPQEKHYAKSIASESPEETRNSVKHDEEDESASPLPSASRGTPSMSPQSSDAENHPPSMKASAPRPQLSSPSKNASVRFPLGASTPSPSKRNTSAGTLKSSHPWVPVNFDEILAAGASDKENVDLQGMKGELTSPEKKMTVEQWIMWNASNGEERLKRECERLVGQFEKEGARAMRALEGIECVD